MPITRLLDFLCLAALALSASVLVPRPASGNLVPARVPPPEAAHATRASSWEAKV